MYVRLPVCCLPDKLHMTYDPTIYKREDMGLANPNVEVLCSWRNTTQSSEYQTYL